MIDYGNILSVHYSNYKWRIDDCFDYNSLKWLDESPKPEKSKLDNLNIKTINYYKKQNCKDQAKQLIASSDWSVLPDVNISNKSDFESYRSQLRNLIINPVEDPIFPVEPNPIWSN